MRLCPPKLDRAHAALRLSARVSLKTPHATIPNVLWFEFPAAQEAFLSESADAFLVALLPLAMVLGEPIEVCGPVSPYLLRAVEEYQRLFHLWLPRWFQAVPVHGELEESEELPIGAAGAATLFSGGVDSFYTLQTRLSPRESLPKYQVTHALFIHGFDIPLEDTATFERASTEYGRMLETLGVQLLTLRTNLRDFLRPVQWEMAHGAASIGSAMTLRGAFSRLYIPSSQTYTETFLWGSDYRADPMLSTPSLTIVNDSAFLCRFDKTLAIAGWPETFHRLRVCWKHPNGLTNCCRCGKCLRTMIALELAGTLSCFSTFPLPLHREQIRSCPFPAYEFEQMGLAAERARAIGRADLAADIRAALLRNRARAAASSTLRWIGLRK
jgi:hypothetical protein